MTEEPTLTVAPNGTRAWYLHDRRHRVDGPAIERADGTRLWYVHGQLHRTDGPAVEYPNGTRAWYVHNQRHRLDGPAYEYSNGTREWYVHGQIVPDPHQVLDRLNDAGDTETLRLVLTAWQPGIDVAELAAAVHAAT